jgi:hypothetical protein
MERKSGIPANLAGLEVAGKFTVRRPCAAKYFSILLVVVVPVGHWKASARALVSIKAWSVTR